VSAGRVALSPLSGTPHYNEFWQAACAALRSDLGPATLASSETWEFPLARLPLLERVLRDKYGLDLAGVLPADLGGGQTPVKARLDLSIPAAAAEAWYDAPDERDRHYHRVLSHAMKAVQATLRCRIPLRYFLDAGTQREGLAAWSVLAYGCMRPFRGKSRVDLIYDATYTDWCLSPRRLVPGELREEFRRRASIAETEGDARGAKHYAVLRATSVLGYIRRFRRPLNRLVFHEGEVVRSLLSFGGALSAARVERNGSKARRAALRGVEHIAQEMFQRCRNHYDRLHCPELPPVVLIEATRALNAVLGRSCLLRASVEIECSGRVFHVAAADGATEMRARGIGWIGGTLQSKLAS
jgi:hypothetical protein